MSTPGRGDPEWLTLQEVLSKDRDNGQFTYGLTRGPEEQTSSGQRSSVYGPDSFQTRGQQVAAGDPETVLTETTIKGRCGLKYGGTYHCWGNSGNKSPNEGSVGVSGTDTDAQTSTSSPS